MQLTNRKDANTVSVKCIDCKRDFDIPFSEKQERAWRSGALIQNVTPQLVNDERELLISGTCGACFDALFADDEEGQSDEVA